MTRKEILQSPEYWVNLIETEIQIRISDYIKTNYCSLEELSDLMEISTKRIKEILISGNPKLTVLELAKISTKLGLAPKIKFTKLEDYK